MDNGLQLDSGASTCSSSDIQVEVKFFSKLVALPYKVDGKWFLNVWTDLSAGFIQWCLAGNTNCMKQQQ